MTWHKKIIFLPILVVIYLSVIFYFDLQQIKNILEGINLQYLFVSVGIWILGLLLRIFRWHEFMKIISKKILFKENILYYLCGLAMIYSPGRLGEIIRAPFIKRDHGIAISKSVSVVLVERYYDFLATIIIIDIAIFFIDLPKIILLIPTVIALSLIIIFTKKQLCLRLLNKLQKIKFTKKFLPNMVESAETIFSLSTPKIFLKNLAFSLIIIVVDAIGIFYILKSVQVELDFMVITAIFHISSLISVISMIPAGTGIFEGGFVGLLVAYGIPQEVGISASLLFRIIVTGGFSIIGLISLRLISNKKMY